MARVHQRTGHQFQQAAQQIQADHEGQPREAIADGATQQPKEQVGQGLRKRDSRGERTGVGGAIDDQQKADGGDGITHAGSQGSQQVPAEGPLAQHPGIHHAPPVAHSRARLSYSQLGQRVHLTAPAVAERVRRLEESGVISGYHARVNLERIGFPVMAFVRMGCTGTICVRRGLRSEEFPEVRELHRVSGDDCSILKVIASSTAHLERLIDRLAVFGRPSTVLVLSTPLDAAVLDVQALHQAAVSPSLAD